MDELKCRKRVLRRLGFATSSDVIEMKGRVACEISRYDDDDVKESTNGQLCCSESISLFCLCVGVLC